MQEHPRAYLQIGDYIESLPDENGLVMDFHDLEAIIENEVLEKVDHKYLNDVFDFNPTCEMIGLWLWEEISSRYKIPGAPWKNWCFGKLPPAI